MSHFIVITEKIIVEDLAKLYKDNVWKLHRLLERTKLCILITGKVIGWNSW